MKKSSFYFDYASSTRTNIEILNLYFNLLQEHYVNCDNLYHQGTYLYNLQEKSRALIASLLKVDKEEVIFVSSGSEANSLAIKGLCLAQNQRKHIITSIYEHSSTYNCMKQLEEMGYEVTYLKPIDGVIKPEQVKQALKKDTILVSIMNVNNEIGTINDINAIKRIVKTNPGTFFHSDIVQAIGKIDVDLSDIDLASYSNHKINGLKGSGVLIKKKHVKILPLVCGGSQEFKLRGGTSNYHVNILAGKTLKLALENLKEKQIKLKNIHDYCLKKLKDLKVNINQEINKIDSIISINTKLKSQVITNSLDEYGIMLSSKSTCNIKNKGNSRSITSINVDDDYTIRISLDYKTTVDEVDYLINALKEILNKYEY